MRRRLTEEAAILALAVQFLTRLPLPRNAGYSAERLAATPRWYPAVGILVGAAAAAVYAVASLLFPPILAALLSTAAGLALTGAFHEDGFADACDGLGGGVTATQALEIMRDSRLGTYGAAGLGLMLAAKVLALGAMAPSVAAPVLIAGHAASRASSVLAIATGTYLRASGTGKPVASGAGRAGLAVAIVTAALAVSGVGVMAGAAALAAGLLGLALGHAIMRRAYGRKLGGYTGDCLGSVQQTSEIGFYLGVLACL
jgi:adenosylcobinamide-GDP ribazoletransferase